jgi:hypothetical protein
MPCMGPSDSEIRDMEARDNERELGKRWTNRQFAENVACAYTAHHRHGEALPDWAVKWSDRHEKEDKERKAREKRQKDAKEAAEYEQFLKLNAKFGKKGK